MSYPLAAAAYRAFDTLDEALDSLFDGDSGAQAGDVDAAGALEGDTSEDSAPAPEPTPAPDEPATPDTDADQGEDAPGTVIEEGLEAALEDARQALADREAAYRNNDLVAAAEADRRLTEALERALAFDQ